MRKLINHRGFVITIFPVCYSKNLQGIPDIWFDYRIRDLKTKKLYYARTTFRDFQFTIEDAIEMIDEWLIKTRK